MLGSTGCILHCFNSLLTNKWEGYLSLLGQFQNNIKLLEFLLKKPLRLLDIVIECNWYRQIDMLNICLAAGMVSVMTIMCVTSYIWVAQLISHLMANTSALIDIMFIVWWMVSAIISWSLWIYKTKVVTLFLTLVFKMIRIVSWSMREFL